MEALKIHHNCGKKTEIGDNSRVTVVSSVCMTSKITTRHYHQTTVGSVLGERRRGWTIIDTTSGLYVVFAGISHDPSDLSS